MGLESVELEHRLFSQTNRSAWFAISVAATPEEAAAQEGGVSPPPLGGARGGRRLAASLRRRAETPDRSSASTSGWRTFRGRRRRFRSRRRRSWIGRWPPPGRCCSRSRGRSRPSPDWGSCAMRCGRWGPTSTAAASPRTSKAWRATCSRGCKRSRPPPRPSRPARPICRRASPAASSAATAATPCRSTARRTSGTSGRWASSSATCGASTRRPPATRCKSTRPRGR